MGFGDRYQRMIETPGLERYRRWVASKPYIKSFLKFGLALEVVGFFGCYYVFRQMNTSQGKDWHVRMFLWNFEEKSICVKSYAHCFRSNLVY